MRNKYECVAVVSAVFLGGCALAIALQPQDPTEMTNQMAAADVPQSAANTTTFKTPWKTFQEYYTNWKSGGAKSLFDCYTAGFQQRLLEGRSTPTDDQFTQIGTNVNAGGHTNFQLISFTFTTNATRPQISAIVTYSDVQTTNRAEQLDLTLKDTASGWKIDDEDGEDKSGQ